MHSKSMRGREEGIGEVGGRKTNRGKLYDYILTKKKEV